MLYATGWFVAVLVYAAINSCVGLGQLKQEPGTVPFFKFVYLGNDSVDHFYTINKTDIDLLVVDEGIPMKANMKEEGIAGYIFPVQKPGTVPLHRYFSKRDLNHYWTINLRDLGQGKPDGYVYQGIVGYVLDRPVSGAVPWFRYFSLYNLDSFFTSDLSELIYAGGSYVPQGIAAYIFSA